MKEITSLNCDLLTVKDVADRLKVSDRYIRLLIARGELPAVKLGRAVRIGVTDLVDFLEARKEKDETALRKSQKVTADAIAKLQPVS